MTLNRNGFTLIELLVIIAIIAILAAVLIPVSMRVQQNAQLSTCTSNMRQLATGLLLYANEHGGDFPAVSKSWPPSNQKETWGYAVWTYVGYENNTFEEPGNDLRSTVEASDHNIFQCPSSQNGPTAFPGVSSSFSSFYSYGMNCDPNGESSLGLSVRTRVKRNQILSPSRTAMLLESRFPVANYYAFRREYGLLPHSGSLNIVYYDGHVSQLMSADIPSGGSAQAFWRGY